MALTLRPLQHFAHTTDIGLSGKFSSALSHFDSRRVSDYVLTGITEKTVDFEAFGSQFPAVMQKVGDAVTYRDEIYGPDGEIIGSAIGFSTVIARRASDGHLISTYEEAVAIGENTMRTAATTDRNAMLTGDWSRFTAVGTGGAFAGKRGIRRWRLAPPLYDPPRPTQHADVEIILLSRRSTLAGLLHR